MKVYEMRCSINGKYLIAAEFEKQVQIWNTECDEKICDIQTHFLFGGKRLTVSNSGKYFSAVNYGRYGVEMYSIEDQQLLWQNKTIKQIQGVYFSADDSILYVINNDSKLYTLSVLDGSVQSIEKNVRYLFLTEFGIIDFIEENRAKADTLLIHCYAGQSRSRAVGALAVEMLGGDNSKYFEEGNVPNMFVYDVLESAWVRRRLNGM